MRVHDTFWPSVLVLPALLWIGVPIAAPPVPGGPGLVFELVTTEASSGRTITTSMAVEGPNLRMEMLEVGDGEPGEVIFRGDRQEMLMVNHDRQTYIVLDRAAIEGLASQLTDAMRQMEAAMANMPAEQRAMMEQMMGGRMPAAAPARTVEVRATGERAENSGYATQRYDVLVNGTRTQELWVTDWNNVEGSTEVRPAFEAMAAFMRELVGTLASGPLGQMIDFDENGYQRLDEVDGFPILTRNFSANGDLQTESLLRSAARTSFAADHFDPPADYRRQEMPR